MKSIGSSSSDEYKSSISRSQHQNSRNTNNSSVTNNGTSNITNQSVNNNNSNNSTKKHGFGFRRFSLRRIFNPSSIGRNVSNKHRNPSTFKDSHSESGSAADNKSISNAKIATYRPTCSSYDAESYSISSGRSEYFHPTLATFIDNSSGSSGPIECPLCLLEQPYSHFPELSTCTHRACHHCLQQYLKIEILESRININCPECTEPLHPNDIQRILNDQNLIEKYETFMLRRILVTEPDARWCPAPDCGYCVIASGCASCPKLKCERPGCETWFCYHCKQEWHPNQTCDAARAQRGFRHSAHGKSSSVSFSHDSIVQRDDIKPCPCCKVLIIKMDDGSCNHMTCSVCGTEFCWLCMKEISDLHYLSPSGCTFWGKKPWSRKKKIMWQLGMLVGAPVGIALIAGIAVPAIIIGIPVWVGRKLHARFERHQMSRHKRNILVTTGVLTSIFVSPILAAVAVGIGVPILLAYVYGVVPISLCRSGGCGVITSASGVRIELDEENEIGIGPNVAADGVSVDTALSNRGVNPSIGEVSLGMSASLSMGSGSHLDRIGSDRENSSTAACAGSIASGSLSNAHKVEIQADVSSNKRFSLSSHCETASATLSFGDRSANMSLMDDASIKALAGSINGYKEATIGYCANSVTPVEVHVDAALMPNNAEHEQDLTCHSLLSETFSGNYRVSSRLSNDNNTTCNANGIDYSVNYIDDTPSPSEQISDQVFTSRINASQNMSQTKYLIGKYESRSLEHLTNYCELCHKTHKPCCPNYVYSHQTNQPIAQSTANCIARRQQSKSVGPSDEEQRRSGKKSSAGFLNKRRTSSIKLKQMSSTHDSHKELKRVHSSEFNINNSRQTNDSRSNFSLSLSSTPTIEVNQTLTQDLNSNENRAYNQNSLSKFFTQKKGSQKAKVKNNSTKSQTFIDIDELSKRNDFCIKSSEV